MDIKKVNWKRALWLVPLFILLVPILAYQNMKDRKASEGELSNLLDNRVEDVKITISQGLVSITYQDNSSIRADGIGIAVVTLKDHKASPDKLKEQSIEDKDFPVLVFFNRTGFDATGLPVSVRSCKDGKLLWTKYKKEDVNTNIQAAVPSSSGGWLVYYWDNVNNKASKVSVDDEEWASYYLNLPSQPKLPSVEELDKMTDEELKTLGLKRKPKEGNKEILKEKPKESKTGLYGNIYKVGGNPALIPLKVPVHAFKGKVNFSPNTKFNPEDENLAGSVTSSEEGKYALPLPPGEYTLTIEIDGKLVGNSLKERFPSILVKEDWKDYDFRYAGAVKKE